VQHTAGPFPESRVSRRRGGRVDVDVFYRRSVAAAVLAVGTACRSRQRCGRKKYRLRPWPYRRCTAESLPCVAVTACHRRWYRRVTASWCDCKAVHREFLGWLSLAPGSAGCLRCRGAQEVRAALSAPGASAGIAPRRHHIPITCVERRVAAPCESSAFKVETTPKRPASKHHH
jgi:hypothetical protein